MGHYRLYCMDGSGKIGLADWFEADTDEEAVHKARELKAGARKCEVWQGTRMVAQLDAQELSRSSG